MLALTLVLVVVLASHPELRLFLPVLDALGLDLVVLLVGVQLLAFARPLARQANRRILLPLAALLYSAFLFFLGMMGPYVNARVGSCRQLRNIAT